MTGCGGCKGCKGSAVDLFPGTVMIAEGMLLPWSDEPAVGVSGMVQLIPAKDLTGAEVNNRDSNWAVLVSGDVLTMGIPGCQVRAVIRHNQPDQLPEFNRNVTKVP